MNGRIECGSAIHSGECARLPVKAMVGNLASTMDGGERRGSEVRLKKHPDRSVAVSADHDLDRARVVGVHVHLVPPFARAAILEPEDRRRRVWRVMLRQWRGRDRSLEVGNVNFGMGISGCPLEE